MNWSRLSGITAVLLLAPLSFCSQPVFKYHIDLTHIDADSFYVRLSLNGFPSDTAMFVFAATVPGVYQRLDIGRFVGAFCAYDSHSHSLEIRHPTVNLYEIHHARELARLEYCVQDSYRSSYAEMPVSPDEGSLLEPHGAILNAHMVCGFFRGFQSAPVMIDFQCPAVWKIATTIPRRNGTYRAESFDELVDSPVLFGDLSHSDFTVGKTRFEVYAFSAQHMISAEMLVDTLRRVAQHVQRFLGGLPVKQYTFLFCFRREIPFSALEHHRSSVYTIPEDSVGPVMGRVMQTVPHELLHLMTPLSVRSEVIDEFNFETPVASRHLWFYEGVTEWATDMMRVRSGLISEIDFRDILVTQLVSLQRFDQKVSLVGSSLACYGPAGNQWHNAYFRGMLVGLILDIRLHELSEGRTDLVDLLRALSRRFGVHRPFADDRFFDVLVEQSHPALAAFFLQYVAGTQPLPIAQYLEKVGDEYCPAYHTGRFVTSVGKWRFSVENERFVVRDPDSSDELTRQLQIRDGDALVKLILQNREVLLGGGRLTNALKEISEGEEFEWVVDRGGVRLYLKGRAKREEVVEEAIKPIAPLSTNQEAIRRWWLGIQ